MLAGDVTEVLGSVRGALMVWTAPLLALAALAAWPLRGRFGGSYARAFASLAVVAPRSRSPCCARTGASASVRGG